jgi:hypothetical protein
LSKKKQKTASEQRASSRARILLGLSESGLSGEGKTKNGAVIGRKVCKYLSHWSINSFPAL